VINPAVHHVKLIRMIQDLLLLRAV